ncbi:LacI family DNA-binding transcriptional regulator [soil metagenome]
MTIKRKRVSVGSLAKQLNLSPSTVSRALRHHSTIAPKTIEKVNSLAKEQGYEARKEVGQYFRSLNKQVNAVDFLVDVRVHDLLVRQDSFYTRIQWAVQKALRAENIHMLLSCLQEDILASGSLYSVEEGMANGVIAKVRDDVMVAKISQHVPVVVLDFESTVENVDSVLSDVARTARKQIDYLVSMGHREIACFRSKSSVGGNYILEQDRIFWREFVDYSSQVGLTIPEAWLKPIHITEENETATIGDFLDRILGSGRPTAILTYDVYAAPLIAALRERNLSVPQDISIVGYDDDAHGRSCPISLTTFRQDFEAMAGESVRLIKDRIRNPDRPSRVIKVEGELIVRESSGAPNPNRLSARR